MQVFLNKLLIYTLIFSNSLQFFIGSLIFIIKALENNLLIFSVVFLDVPLYKINVTFLFFKFILSKTLFIGLLSLEFHIGDPILLHHINQYYHQN